MRGLFCKLTPFTPDSVAACAVFADNRALVIANDFNGTISTYRQRVGLSETSPMQICSTLGVKELSYVFGNEDDFIAEYHSILENTPCDFVVLIHGPVSAVSGVNLSAFAERLEAEIAVPVLAVDCSGSGSYEKGLAAAMRAVLDRISRNKTLEPEPQQGMVNILGINHVDHHDRRSRDTFEQALLQASGLQIASRWGWRDSWNEWCYAPFAELNIVASLSALSLAKTMEKRWGIPYVRADELLEGTDALLEAYRYEQDPVPHTNGIRDLRVWALRALDDSKVLIVGEQIAANIVRSTLAAGDECVRSQISVASFFTLSREQSLPRDRKLVSESDFVRYVKEEEFDLVIADPALACCLPGNTPLFPYGHSALSGGSHLGTPDAPPAWMPASTGDASPWESEMATEHPAALTPEWFADLFAFILEMESL